MPSPSLPPDFDFTDPDLCQDRLPVEELAELRRTASVWWNDQPIGKGGFNDGGFWVVTKHKDVKEVSLRCDVFSSWQNTALPRYKDDARREDIDVGRFAVLNMDPPHHTRLRKIISRGFTSRVIERLRDELNQRAHDIANAAVARGCGDFVDEVASELPLQAIAGLLGVPEQDRSKLFHWSNEMIGEQDPEYSQMNALGAAVELVGYASQLAELKINTPGQDIVTTLLEADIDGQKLSYDEFGFFVVMLAVAGNETTRNAITHGMIAFTEFPAQWELFKTQRPKSAADEIVRWATPVTAFQRTALRDVQLGGALINQGQRVVMFYRSANFDEDVFDDPFTFDIMRNPNPHVGFGGTGEHYCIGANLARMTIDLMFGAIADHMPDLAPVSAPQRLRSGFFNGIKHWQVNYAGG